MNTFERSPKRPTTTRRLEINSAWFTGAADVPTFALEELLATKIRALYQGAKGRDAFDLWLVARAFDVDPNDIAECFEAYRPEGWTPLRARTNLAAKVRDGAYLEDLRPLVADWPEGFDGGSAEAAVARILDAAASSFACHATTRSRTEDGGPPSPSSASSNVTSPAGPTTGAPNDADPAPPCSGQVPPSACAPKVTSMESPIRGVTSPRPGPPDSRPLTGERSSRGRWG